MQNRSRVINKLALVLLSIVVLELVLIGDSVQPVKAIKKKIILKKLKKILPLLALIKPKKKLILLPIPIPMFKNQGQHNQNRPRPFGPSLDGSTAPMSFMVLPQGGSSEGPGLVSSSLPMEMNMIMTSGNNQMDQFLVQTMMPQSTPTARPASPPVVVAKASESQPMAMIMPSMTMTFQSEAGGGTSAIEVSTNMGNTSAPLVLMNQQHGQGTKLWNKQNHQPLQQQADFFDFDGQPENEQGELYYSSPWSSPNRPPPESPAKLVRQQQRGPPMSSSTTTTRPQNFNAPSSPAPTQSSRLVMQQPQQSFRPQPQMHMPVLLIKNQWRPVPSNQLRQEHREKSARQEPGPAPRSQQQQQRTTVRPPLPSPSTSPPPPPQPQQEYEELVPVGPPRVMPVYQTPNGQLYLSPPEGHQEAARSGPPPPPTPPISTSQPSGPPVVTPSQLSGDLTSNSSLEQEDNRQTPSSQDQNGEVQTLSNNNLEQDYQTTTGTMGTTPSSRFTSPAVKGKQQQSGRKKPISGGGY